MKIISVVSNKIKVEFQDGTIIEIQESSNGHMIKLPKEYRLK